LGAITLAAQRGDAIHRTWLTSYERPLRSGFVFDADRKYYTCPQEKLLVQFRRTFVTPRLRITKDGLRKRLRLTGGPTLLRYLEQSSAISTRSPIAISKDTVGSHGEGLLASL
jgi:hypothetical protein